jgi:hypothetical protein
MPNEAAIEEKFGELMEASKPWAAGNPIDEWEANHYPDSLTKLTTQSSIHLVKLMESISQGFELNTFVYSDVRIIWLVDVYGDIIFSIEESIDGEGNPLRFPFHKQAQRFGIIRKLGHPSLVGGRMARIAGEIYYDYGAAKWVINSSSGRYSSARKLTKLYVMNVAEVFEKFGVSLFVDPRS